LATAVIAVMAVSVQRSVIAVMAVSVQRLQRRQHWRAMMVVWTQKLWWQCLRSDCGSSVGAVISAMSTVLAQGLQQRWCWRNYCGGGIEW